MAELKPYTRVVLDMLSSLRIMEERHDGAARMDRGLLMAPREGESGYVSNLRRLAVIDGKKEGLLDQFAFEGIVEDDGHLRQPNANEKANGSGYAIKLGAAGYKLLEAAESEIEADVEAETSMDGAGIDWMKVNSGIQTAVALATLIAMFLPSKK